MSRQQIAEWIHGSRPVETNINMFGINIHFVGENFCGYHVTLDDFYFAIGKLLSLKSLGCEKILFIYFVDEIEINENIKKICSHYNIYICKRYFDLFEQIFKKNKVIEIQDDEILQDDNEDNNENDNRIMKNSMIIVYRLQNYMNQGQHWNYMCKRFGKEYEKITLKKVNKEYQRNNPEEILRKDIKGNPQKKWNKFLNKSKIAYKGPGRSPIFFNLKEGIDQQTFITRFNREIN